MVRGLDWKEVELLARNNLGDWWDDDPTVRFERASEKVYQAIKVIRRQQVEDDAKEEEAKEIAQGMCKE